MWSRVFILGCFSITASVADDVTSPPTVSTPDPSTPASVSKPRKKKKAPRIEQKENEGTQAKNRFEADSILKSEYHLNGQPLEVDPD